MARKGIRKFLEKNATYVLSFIISLFTIAIIKDFETLVLGTISKCSTFYRVVLFVVPFVGLSYLFYFLLNKGFPKVNKILVIVVSVLSAFLMVTYLILVGLI